MPGPQRVFGRKQPANTAARHDAASGAVEWDGPIRHRADGTAWDGVERRHNRAVIVEGDGGDVLNAGRRWYDQVRQQDEAERIAGTGWLDGLFTRDSDGGDSDGGGGDGGGGGD